VSVVRGGVDPAHGGKRRRTAAGMMTEDADVAAQAEIEKHAEARAYWARFHVDGNWAWARDFRPPIVQASDRGNAERVLDLLVQADAARPKEGVELAEIEKIWRKINKFKKSDKMPLQPPAAPTPASPASKRHALRGAGKVPAPAAAAAGKVPAAAAAAAKPVDEGIGLGWADDDPASGEEYSDEDEYAEEEVLVEQPPAASARARPLKPAVLHHNNMCCTCCSPQPFGGLPPTPQWICAGCGLRGDLPANDPACNRGI